MHFEPALRNDVLQQISVYPVHLLDAILDIKNRNTHLLPQVFEAYLLQPTILEHYAVRCEHDQCRQSQAIVSICLDQLNAKRRISVCLRRVLYIREIMLKCQETANWIVNLC